MKDAYALPCRVKVLGDLSPYLEPLPPVIGSVHHLTGGGREGVVKPKVALKPDRPAFPSLPDRQPHLWCLSFLTCETSHNPTPRDGCLGWKWCMPEPDPGGS